MLHVHRLGTQAAPAPADATPTGEYEAEGAGAGDAAPAGDIDVDGRGGGGEGGASGGEGEGGRAASPTSLNTPNVDEAEELLEECLEIRSRHMSKYAAEEAARERQLEEGIPLPRRRSQRSRPLVPCRRGLRRAPSRAQ